MRMAIEAIEAISDSILKAFRAPPCGIWLRRAPLRYGSSLRSSTFTAFIAFYYICHKLRLLSSVGRAAHS